MYSFREKPLVENYWLFILLTIAALIILLLDIYFYSPVADAVPYVVIMVLSLWCKGQKEILVLAALATVCTFVGLFHSQINNTEFPGWDNSIVTLLILWTVSLMVYMQKEASISNKVNQQRLQILHDNNPTMYFSVDEEGKVLTVNDFGARQLGYDTDELIGNDVYGVFDVLDHSQVQEHLNTCLKNPGQTHQWEIQKIKKNGERIWVRETARCTSSVNQQPIIFIVCEDISAEIQAQQALTEQEQMMRAAFEEAPIGFSLKSISLNYLELNNAFCDIVGYSRDELLQMQCSDITHPDDVRQDAAYINRMISGEFSSYSTIKRYIAKSGEYIWVKLFSSIILNDKQVPKYIISIIEDVTRQKESEEKLQYKNRALKVLNESNDVIIYESELNKMLEKICRIIVDTGGYKLAWVGFANKDNEKSISVIKHAGYDDGYLADLNLTWADNKYGRGPAGVAVRTKDVAIFKDIENNTEFLPWKDAAIERGYGSVAGFPIQDKKDTFGVLVIYAPDKDAFEIEELALLERLSNNLSYAMTTIYLRYQRKKAEQLLELEKRSLELITRNMPLNETLEQLLVYIEEFLDDVCCSILLTDSNQLRLVHCAAPSLPEAYTRAVDGVSIGPAAGSCGTAAYRNEQVIVTDINADPLWENYRGLAQQCNLRACWSTPIRSRKDGSVIATFANYYDHVRKPTDEEINFIERMSSIVEIAINHKRSEEALLASKARYKSIIEVSRVVPWEMDMDTYQTTYIGPHVNDIFGYDRDNWYRKDFWLSILHEDDKGHVISFFQKHTDSEDKYDLKYRIYDASNNIRWIRDISRVVVQEDDTKVLRGIMVDITDSIQTEEQLLQVQKMEALGQLTGGIAHDFNNLLTIIKGNLQLLEEEVCTDDESDMLTTIIRDCFSAADDASSLNQQLLSFSRKQYLNPKNVFINEFIENWVRFLPRVLGDNIEIRTKFKKQKHEGWFDPNQFETALLNLAINARDAMVDGGTLTIETGSSMMAGAAAVRLGLTEGNYVTVTIKDSGIGMDEEVMAHAIEPFYTTKEVGEGSGLGLSMVFGFAEQSGGGLKISSAINKGTSVTVYLPAIEQKRADIKHNSEDKIPLLGGDESILVVEDDSRVRSFTVRALKSLGYRVLEAGDASEAIDILGQNKSINLVFSDNVLPGRLKGRELASYISKNHPQIKVLLTTGYTKEVKAMDSIYDGEFPFLKKPFTKDELGLMIRSELDDVIH